MSRAAVAAIAVLALAAGCGDDDGPLTPATLGPEAVVEYRYGDASVPPQYHRSYTLTITRTEVHAVVDSYGDVLAETTVPLPAEVWDRLAARVARLSGISDDDGDDGCTGGTSRELTVTDGDSVVVDADVSVCGGSGSDDADRIDDAVAPVIAAIPDFDALVHTDSGVTDTTR